MSEPLLDHRLIEFAATLPESMRIRGGQGKWLMKKAMRRFLPAVLPAVLLCATWMLQRIRPHASASWQRWAVWAAGGLMLVSPLATWGSILVTTEYGGRASEVEALCQHVQGSRVVVVRGAEPPLLPTLRIVCDADVIEVPAAMDEAALAEAHRAWGGGTVHVVAGREGTIPWPEGAPPTLVTPMARWPHSLYPIRSPVRFTSELWVGTVGADGRVTPVG